MKIVKAEKRVGMSEIRYEVSRDGKPFGMIWTWPNTRTERHPWHAKPLNGERRMFWGRNGFRDAKWYMGSHAPIGATR